MRLKGRHQPSHYSRCRDHRMNQFRAWGQLRHIGSIFPPNRSALQGYTRLFRYRMECVVHPLLAIVQLLICSTITVIVTAITRGLFGFYSPHECTHPRPTDVGPNRWRIHPHTVAVLVEGDAFVCLAIAVVIQAVTDGFTVFVVIGKAT